MPAEGVPGVISSATTEIGPSQLSVAVSTELKDIVYGRLSVAAQRNGCRRAVIEYRCCRVILVAECHRAGVCIVAALVIDIHGERLGERAGCGAGRRRPWSDIVLLLPRSGRRSCPWLLVLAQGHRLR